MNRRLRSLDTSKMWGRGERTKLFRLIKGKFDDQKMKKFNLSDFKDPRKALMSCYLSSDN